ncbi:MAG: hypothetical protein M1823_006062 [Watsoniomyces obsoletus]|nr:MAG: hypothetical protein M1823_006062 [Watsoniomyces obsoletus]
MSNPNPNPQSQPPPSPSPPSQQAFSELQTPTWTKESFSLAFPREIDPTEYLRQHEEKYGRDRRGWNTDLQCKRDYENYKTLEKKRDIARMRYQVELDELLAYLNTGTTTNNTSSSSSSSTEKGTQLMEYSTERLSRKAWEWAIAAHKHASARSHHLISHPFSHRASKRKTAYQNRMMHRSNTLAAFDEHEEAHLLGCRIAEASPAELERWVKIAAAEVASNVSTSTEQRRQPEWFRGDVPNKGIRLSQLTIAFNRIVLS